MSVKVTILGCGASLGVPAAGNFWGDCDPSNPKNYRTRASILIQSETTNILVDTTPDVRIQLNRHDIDKIDGIIYSHDHSDHINGMDDLRVISYVMGHPIEVYTNTDTSESLQKRFNYVFNGGYGIYKPFLKLNERPYGVNKIGDIEMTWFEQDHGTCKTIGIRVGDFAYSVDMLDLNDAALEALKGVKTWVVDAGGYKLEDENLTTHASLGRVQKWVEHLGVEKTYLTVQTGRMDYDVLCDELPDHIRPLYDGLELEI